MERYLEPVLRRAQSELENSNDMEVILRAQGARRGIKQVLARFEDLINDVKREEEENGS